MAVPKLQKMIDEVVKKRNTKVDQLYFLDINSLKSLYFIDKIINTTHNSDFKQRNLPK